MKFEYAKSGLHFVLTEKGYLATRDMVKHERRIGLPVKGYEYFVPASWVAKGYVELSKE